MSTLRDLLGDKWPEGTKVRIPSYSKDEWFRPVYLTTNGYYYGLKDSGNNGYDHGTGSCKWEIIKQTKKITLYKYTYKSEDGIEQSEWVSFNWESFWKRYSINGWDSELWVLLKIESKEIEIEEK